jgi:hypothetical protein
MYVSNITIDPAIYSTVDVFTVSNASVSLCSTTGGIYLTIY